MASRHVLAGFGVALVVVAVVTGLIMIGPPSEERARRLDERRVADLQAVRYAVDVYVNNHGRLPTSLVELRQEPVADLGIRDPSTNQDYRYRPLVDRRYQVCATFDRESPREAEGTFWMHGLGMRCFDLEAAEPRR